MERRPGEGIPMWRLGTFRAPTLCWPWRDLGDIRRSHSRMLLLQLLLRACRTRRHLWDRHDSLLGFEDKDGQQVSVGRSLCKCLVSWEYDVPNAGCQLLQIKGNEAAWCSGYQAACMNEK